MTRSREAEAQATECKETAARKRRKRRDEDVMQVAEPRECHDLVEIVGEGLLFFSSSSSSGLHPPDALFF